MLVRHFVPQNQFDYVVSYGIIHCSFINSHFWFLHQDHHELRPAAAHFPRSAVSPIPKSHHTHTLTHTNTVIYRQQLLA